MPTRRQFLIGTAAAGGIGVLPGCADEGSSASLDEGDALRLRVWSEAAASAYELSLEAFTETSGIEVEVEVLRWEDYWITLPLDLAAGSLPDVLWMNTANLAQACESGELIEIGQALGEDSAQWAEVAADLYRTEDGLWGVPQLWDRTMVVAHQELVEDADGDASALSFDPEADSDPLRELARALTLDEEDRHPGDEDFDAGGRRVFGFSAHPDRTGLLGPFIAGQGGTWQDEEGAFAFADAEGVSAVQYLADLAVDHLAPEGARTAEDATLCRDLFVQGRLGLLQTGTYDLGTLAEEIDGSFPWSVHPEVAGPAGAHPLVHAVAAVGVTGSDDDRTEAVVELLRWLGSAEGQRPLVEARLGIPGHRDLHGAWQEAWEEEGVDVSALDAAPQSVARPETGIRSAEGTGAALPIIAEVFTGEAEAAEALPRAQDAAQEAAG